MEIRFRHLSPTEIAVAKEFLRRVYPNFLRVETDVPLKTLKPAELNLVEPYKSMWEYLTAKKIDLVVELEEKIVIAEIKEKISASAFGQLKLYEELYKQQYKPIKPLELWHCAMYDDPTVRLWLEKKGVKVFVIHKIIV